MLLGVMNNSSNSIDVGRMGFWPAGCACDAVVTRRGILLCCDSSILVCPHPVPPCTAGHDLRRAKSGDEFNPEGCEKARNARIAP